MTVIGIAQSQAAVAIGAAGIWTGDVYASGAKHKITTTYVLTPSLLPGEKHTNAYAHTHPHTHTHTYT